MVIAFDENERKTIESAGIQIIELKRVLYKTTDSAASKILKIWDETIIPNILSIIE